MGGERGAETTGAMLALGAWLVAGATDGVLAGVGAGSGLGSGAGIDTCVAGWVRGSGLGAVSRSKVPVSHAMPITPSDAPTTMAAKTAPMRLRRTLLSRG
jgi:hypothetical protein